MVRPVSTPAPKTRLLLALLSRHLLLLPLSIPGAIAMAQPQAPPRPYLDAVCKPPTHRTGEVVPALHLRRRDRGALLPNDTTPLHLEAARPVHVPRLYFAEWSACRACLSLHGLLPEDPEDPGRASLYAAVVAEASSALCGFLADPPATPPPSVPFRALSSSAEAVALAGRPRSGGGGGASGSNNEGPGPGDKAPSRTEVSLYYTPTGPQGPGPITGSAALASATGLQFATGKPRPLGTAGSSPPPPVRTTSPPLTPSGTGASGSSRLGPLPGDSLSISRAAVGLTPGKTRVLVSLGFWAVAAGSVL
ncbi:hypothetical protein MAPG_05476 [Magnaporthiopsis poae ATCC 64411]|uniref:Uncharacterized protein n=1 Tax=Magnaporthiopsis poae (strain ATCC 64411 / 73-15) TaxID=644358 RepID=A0A0C4DZH5_MAGP6|nr:hypothetical protein MAPG_05476 [Magnaporthiopsis poae ATCC 64411]